MNLRRFMHRSRKDEDLAEEIASHLAHEQDAKIARGLPEQEARRQARLKFGNPRTTRTTTWPPLGLSSAAVKVRPAAKGAPDMLAASASAGTPSPAHQSSSKAAVSAVHPC